MMRTILETLVRFDRPYRLELRRPLAVVKTYLATGHPTGPHLQQFLAPLRGQVAR
jgi:hypothetical protein